MPKLTLNSIGYSTLFVLGGVVLAELTIAGLTWVITQAANNLATKKSS